MTIRLCLLLLIIAVFAAAFSELVRHSGRHVAGSPSSCTELDPGCFGGSRQPTEQ